MPPNPFDEIVENAGKTPTPKAPPPAAAPAVNPFDDIVAGKAQPPAPKAAVPRDPNAINVFDKKYWTPVDAKIDTSAPRPDTADDTAGQLTEPLEAGHRGVQDAVGTVAGLWDAAKKAGHDITHPADLLTDVKSAFAPAVKAGKYAIENPGAALKALPQGLVGAGKDVINSVANQVAYHPLNTALTIATGPKNVAGGVAKNVAEAIPDAIKSPISTIGGGVVNHLTGVGDGVMQEAYRSGTMGDKIAADFREGLRNPGESAQVSVDRAKQGIRVMKDAMLDNYADLKKVWSSDTTPLSFDSINKAEKDLMDSLTTKGKNGPIFKGSDADRAKIQKMQDAIETWRQDPTLHNIEGFDDLKQKIRNEMNYKTDSDVVARAATTLSGAAKDSILSQIPDNAVYKKAMKGYFDAADHVNDIEKSLALGKKADASTSISRLQSVMRNNANTLYGTRKSFADALEKEGDVSLMPGLAGQAASSWRPRGIAAGVQAGSLPLAAAEMAMHHGFDPVSIAAGLTGAAATSPRLMAEGFHGMGNINRALAPGLRQASPLGLPATALRTAVDQPSPPPARRRGGYFGGI